MGCAWTVAEGVITADTPALFAKFLDEEGAAGTVMLHSEGGDASAAIELSRAFRANGVDTMIGMSRAYFDAWHEPVEGGKCLGPCALAFLGGKNRTVGLKTFNHQMTGDLAFEKIKGSEMIASIDASVTGEDRLQEQMEIGVFVNFLLEMDVSPELYAALSKLPLGQRLEVDAKLAGELNVASSVENDSKWQLIQFGNGLAVSTRPTKKSDSVLSAFCHSGVYVIGRSFTEVDSDGDPCDDNFCYPINNMEVRFDGSSVEIAGNSFGVEYIGTMYNSGADGERAVVMMSVSAEALKSLPKATGITLIPREQSRVMLAESQVMEFYWGETFDSRLIDLAMKNCAG